MAFHLQTFLTRLGSALVFAVIMLTGLLWHEWSFVALFFIVNILCLREYVHLVEHIMQVRFQRNEIINFMACGIALFFFIITLPVRHCDNQTALLLAPFTFHALGLFIGALLIFIFFRKSPKSFYLLTGLGYISVALSFLVLMRFESILLPLILILFIWMNDSLAYLVGSFLGRTPFFPSISPKKTWEGTMGGILFTMALAYIWGINTNWFPISFWILMGLIASLIGTIGDLVESKLKRMAGIKDSGSLMPGHGGALDRFDSLLLSAPFAFFLSILFEICKQMNFF